MERSIPLPERYSNLLILPDNKADIFYASLIISYCSFSFLFLSSVVMISFYILSKRFFLKREVLSDARAASITKKKSYSFLVINANLVSDNPSRFRKNLLHF